MPDPYNLQRFLTAQAPIYPDVLRELRQQRKTTHWIWFIFPQLQGLGSSPTARAYAITSLDEAAAYLAHPILGPRLIECTQLVLLARAHPLRQILGTPDDLKFHSSMTLFAHATPDNHLFLEAMQAFFAGRYDDLTLNLLANNHAATHPKTVLRPPSCSPRLR
jgi:uncharacterized protein (DUF1810 family)